MRVHFLVPLRCHGVLVLSSLAACQPGRRWSPAEVTIDPAAVTCKRCRQRIADSRVYQPLPELTRLVAMADQDIAAPRVTTHHGGRVIPRHAAAPGAAPSH